MGKESLHPGLPQVRGGWNRAGEPPAALADHSCALQGLRFPFCGFKFLSCFLENNAPHFPEVKNPFSFSRTRLFPGYWQTAQQWGQPLHFHSQSPPASPKSGRGVEVPVAPHCVTLSGFCWKTLVFLPALPAEAGEVRRRAAGGSRGLLRGGGWVSLLPGGV